MSALRGEPVPGVPARDGTARTRRSAPLLAACLAMSLHGCVGVGAGNGPAPASGPVASVPDGRGVELVARDFANAVGQLPGNDPSRVRLMFASDGADLDPMLGALRRELASAGFGGTADAGRVDVSVDHRRTPLPEAGPDAWRVELAVGPARLRRDYRDTAAGPRPLTPMLVRGADAAAIRAIDDELYGPAPSEADAGLLVDADPDTGAEPATPPEPDVLVLTSALLDGAGDGARSVSGGAAPDDPAVAMQRTVGFARGSASLSPADAGLVDEVLASYRPDAHLVAVFGTSLGTAAAASDNRAMALARGASVKRALVAGGVPAERVRVSGLWLAAEASAGLPTRGAVVQLRLGAR